MSVSPWIQEEIFMKDGEELFLYCIAIISLLFALWNYIQMIHRIGKTKQTVGTVFSIVSPNPDKTTFRNSKWAQLAYRVNGRNYVSVNRIQVPMASEIGSEVKIRYDVAQPDRLYSYSSSRIIISIGITVLCIIAVKLF